MHSNCEFLSRTKESQSSTTTVSLESIKTKDLYRSSMEAGCRTGHLTYSWPPPVRHPPKRLVEDVTGESLKQRARSSLMMSLLKVFDIRAFRAKWYLHVVCDIYTCGLIRNLGKYVDEQSYKLLSQNQIDVVEVDKIEADKCNLFIHVSCTQIGSTKDLQFSTLNLHNLMANKRKLIDNAIALTNY